MQPDKNSRKPNHLSVRRRLAMGAIAAAVLGTLVGWGGSRAPVSASSVTIGFENNGADPEMVAIDKNYFSKYMHANVSLKYFDSGPAALAALASGALQFMTGIGNPPTAAAIARGLPVQLIWAQERYTTDEGLVVKDNSGIKSLKDLAGKTVALVLGSTSPFELDTALRKVGMSSSSVHLLNMSPPAMREAWARGSIYAAYVWDPVFDTIRHEHGRVLMVDDDVKSEAPIYNLAIVNSSWAKSHADMVKGFIQAEDVAVKYYRDEKHRADALKSMAKEAGISVSLATVELAGYEFFDARQQLGHDALGYGKTVSSSLATKSLSSAAAYLERIGTISSAPKSMVPYVNPTYAKEIAGTK